MKVEIKVNETSPVSSIQPSGVLGAGNLATIIWDRGNDSRYSIFRADRNNGRVDNVLAPSDVPDLAKLATLLAKIFHEDDQLDQELRDDLGCLAHCLEEVFPPNDKHERFPELVARSFFFLMESLIAEQGKAFTSAPSESHAYRHLLVIDAWFRGVPAHYCQLDDLALFVSPPPGFSLCPICGQNDGLLSVRRESWFYCDRHQLRWFANDNIFAFGCNETKQSGNNWEQLCLYREVAPYKVESETEENY